MFDFHDRINKNHIHLIFLFILSLNYLVPFKRNEKLKIEVTNYTDEVSKKVYKAQRLVNSSFKASIPYYRNS